MSAQAYSRPRRSLGLMRVEAMDAGTLAGGPGRAAMTAWALAINLTPATRTTESEWIAAIAPAVPLIVAAIFCAWPRIR
jgi:hypothetical protein